MSNIELEARFTDIDPQNLIEFAKNLGAEDKGSKFLKETIFYDKELKWRSEGKYARLRSFDNKNIFTYKHITKEAVDGAEEIEFEVTHPDNLQLFLERVGLIPFRVQEKKRHTLELEGVTLDFDQWPLIPPYLEIEGKSEEKIREIALQLGLKWEDTVFSDARKIIEGYGVDVSKFTYFTFEKCE